MTYSEYRAQFSSVEKFMRAYGRLTKEEAIALIDAEYAPNFIKACMITTWYQARRKVKLALITVRVSESGELNIAFFEDKKKSSGNAFEYSYSLDAENTETFLKTIRFRYADPKTTFEEWLVNNIDCDGRGLDLMEKWIQMGLHGKRFVHEDYPGGVSSEEEF